MFYEFRWNHVWVSSRLWNTNFWLTFLLMSFWGIQQVLRYLKICAYCYEYLIFCAIASYGEWAGRKIPQNFKYLSKTDCVLNYKHFLVLTARNWTVRAVRLCVDEAVLGQRAHALYIVRSALLRKARLNSSRNNVTTGSYTAEANPSPTRLWSFVWHHPGRNSTIFSMAHC